MTDTERRTEIQKLLPDNSNGDISALDLRNIVIMLSQDLQVNTDNNEANTHRLADKVAKIVGKGLSTEDFTTALKTKLSTMEGSLFKGIHADLVKLEAAHPGANAEAGSYAYIKKGTDPERVAMLDGTTWTEQTATSQTPLTAAQIKHLYEGNVDTNAFTDNEKQAIVAFALLGLVMDVPNSIITTPTDIKLLHPQTVSQDPTVVARDDRLITVSNAFAIEIGLKAFIDQTFMKNLDKDNPTMKLPVSDTGLAAQMQVIYKGHDVASMEWLKSSGSFVFSLADKDTGVQKATFEIKTDGKAYVNGKQIISMQDLDDSGVMFARGIITDVNNITTSGIYEGVNVANAPVTGAVIIEAYKDAAGNIDLTLKDPTMRRYEGRKQAGSSAVWHNAEPHHLYGDAVPADTLGEDGDLYFKTV